jgi:hypothetical protein
MFEADGLSCRFDNDGGLVLELYKEDNRANGHIVYMTAEDVASQSHILADWAKRRPK